MTLQQTTENIRAAAAALDLAALQAAMREREAVIDRLHEMPPTLELRDAVVESIAAGQEAKWAIGMIRQRLLTGKTRLTQLENGFGQGRRATTAHHVDCTG